MHLRLGTREFVFASSLKFRNNPKGEAAVLAEAVASV